MVDLILVAICAYVFYQLFNVLGQKPPSGAPRARPNPIDVAMTQAEKKPDIRQTSSKKRAQETAYEARHPQATELLKRIDPDLSPLSFLQASAGAFEMITRAYCAGDREILERLVEANLFKSFNKSIKRREELGHQEVLDELIIQKIAFEKALVKSGTALISVRIVSQQKRDVLNAQGHYVDVEQVDADTPVIDVWTFTRPLESEDPTWVLKQAVAV
jgi:predicted lipid-binding transport protein (Tim44 family)